MSNLGPIDQQLLQIVTAAQPANIPDVIQGMQAINALLPNDDGLKWFNKLYLMVTQQIDGQPPATAWSDGAWLTRLDVVFAGYYFAAIESFCRMTRAHRVPGMLSSKLETAQILTVFSSR